MNILFICDEYPPGKHGGIGTIVQLLSRQLVKGGNKVIVTGIYNNDYEALDYEVDNGVIVYRKKYGSRFLNINLKNFIFLINNPVTKRYLKFRGKLFFYKFISHIEKIIEDEKIDVIETADWFEFATKLQIEYQWPKFRAPLVLRSHGSYTYFQKEAGEEMISILKTLKTNDFNLFKRADAICSVSKYTSNVNKNIFSLNSETKVLYNAVKLRSYSEFSKRSRNTVVFTGSLFRKKGIYELISAWNFVCENHPEATLHIYGKGDNSEL